MRINYRNTNTKSSSCDFFRDCKIMAVIAGLSIFCVFVLPIILAILKNLYWILPLTVIAGACWFVPFKTLTNIRYNDGTCNWPKSKIRNRNVR